MKKFILQVLRRNAYIILAAAWLFTIAFIINNYWLGASSIKTLRKDIEERIQTQEKDFLTLTMDTATINKLVSEQYDESTLNAYINKPYSIFIYQQDEQDGWLLKSWNNQLNLPNNDLLYSKEKNRFVKISSGEYEVVKRIVEVRPGHTLLAVALIPIRKEYFIEIPNLKHEFDGFPHAERSVAISHYTTDFPVISSFGNTLFYLQSKNVFAEKSTNSFAVVLSLLGIVFSLIFIQSLAHSIAEKYGSLTGVVFIIGVVFFLRTSMYIFHDFINLRQFNLFDPAIYSSNFILNSLGDLLINTFLASWIVLFIRKEIGDFNFSTFRSTKLKWPLIVLTLFVLVAATFIYASIIQSLISDARISFDVTNFFSLDQNSFVGFVILATLSLSFFFLAQILLQLVRPLLDKRKYILYAVCASIGLLLLSFIKANTFVELNIFVLIWLLAFIWLMQQRFITGLTSRLHISQIIFWIFVFSVSVSAIIIAENNRAELLQRKRTAAKLLAKADPSSERIINIALAYFDNDFLFANFNRFKIPNANLYLKDSLINRNFGAYLNQFETSIYTFDASEKNLYNEDPISYDTLNTIFSIEGKQTSVNDLKYFEKSFDKFAYICKKTVTDKGGLKVGYLFILSEPKKYKSDALVPELFKQNKDLSSENSARYSYAIFNDARLVDYSSDYRFPTYLDSLQIPKQEFTELRRNGYSELWYSNSGKVVIIARNNNYLIEAITLFAYLFSTFLLLVALFRIISILVQTRLRWEFLKHYWQFNIRSQIHGTIIFISLFSFLVIGIATIVFFINRYHKNKQDSLSKSLQIITGEVQNKLVSHSMFNDMVKLYEGGDSDYLERLVNEVAETHGMDINIYNLEGDMEVSSHPLVYTKGILSMKMNPMAYYYMHQQRLIQYAGEEQIGGFTYQSIYCPVRDENGQPYAYINIPSFDTQAELKREISNFLVTIINLNAFIFLIAGVIALFITNRITSSFTLIGDKMKEINLGKMNEEIKWRRNDEIGGLVTEYNKMVKKLEDSASALAKSEREGAWREMARQVAHEIKNPLTPMKLSIQYLQKAIDNKSDNVKELSSSVAKTLIEQIDHLSKIAADFSQFANIGNVKMELFDLHELLQSLTSLYKATENMEFTWVRHPNPVWIMADKTQMNRLFTNLLQNAVEASDEKDFRTISLNEEVLGDMIVIQVTDSGDGIPEAMRSKIFTPNFTTKSSGTGLGLAMSKTIVEQAKGNIWFATVEGEGTTFFVELPIIRA